MKTLSILIASLITAFALGASDPRLENNVWFDNEPRSPGDTTTHFNYLNEYWVILIKQSAYTCIASGGIRLIGDDTLYADGCNWHIDTTGGCMWTYKDSIDNHYEFFTIGCTLIFVHPDTGAYCDSIVPAIVETTFNAFYQDGPCDFTLYLAMDDEADTGCTDFEIIFTDFDSTAGCTEWRDTTLKFTTVMSDTNLIYQVTKDSLVNKIDSERISISHDFEDSNYVEDNIVYFQHRRIIVQVKDSTDGNLYFKDDTLVHVEDTTDSGGGGGGGVVDTIAAMLANNPVPDFGNVIYVGSGLAYTLNNIARLNPKSNTEFILAPGVYCLDTTFLANANGIVISGFYEPNGYMNKDNDVRGTYIFTKDNSPVFELNGEDCGLANLSIFNYNRAKSVYEVGTPTAVDTIGLVVEIRGEGCFVRDCNVAFTDTLLALRGVIDINANGVEITNTNIHGVNQIGISIGDSSCVSNRGLCKPKIEGIYPSRVLISNCNIGVGEDDSLYAGIFIRSKQAMPRHLFIENNKIGYGNGYGIYISGCDTAFVHNNIVRPAGHGMGIPLKITSYGISAAYWTRDITFKNNYFHTDARVEAIELDSVITGSVKFNNDIFYPDGPTPRDTSQLGEIADSLYEGSVIEPAETLFTINLGANWKWRSYPWMGSEQYVDIWGDLVTDTVIYNDNVYFGYRLDRFEYYSSRRTVTFYHEITIPEYFKRFADTVAIWMVEGFRDTMWMTGFEEDSSWIPKALPFFDVAECGIILNRNAITVDYASFGGATDGGLQVLPITSEQINPASSQVAYAGQKGYIYVKMGVESYRGLFDPQLERPRIYLPEGINVITNSP